MLNCNSVTRRSLLGVVLYLICLNGYSQVRFESGYFINNNNERINCKIKNASWLNNPTSFEYKISDADEAKTGTAEDVREFSITDGSRYVSARVAIDRSSNKVTSLSKVGAPEFKQELLFLKVLVDGKATLYQYQEKDLLRFFYKTESDSIKQLVYKRYLSGLTEEMKQLGMEPNRIYENEQFKQQILNEVSCPGTTLSDVKRIKYYRNDLEWAFEKYNHCTDPDYINEKQKEIRSSANLTLRAGLNFINASIIQRNNGLTFGFPKSIEPRFGLELEYFLPFAKRNWAFVLEPTYHQFSGETEITDNQMPGGNGTAIVDYASIEFPFSVRYSIFLGPSTRIFTNISYMIDVPLNSSQVTILRYDDTVFRTVEVNTNPNYGFGLGLNHKEKYSLELRYMTDRTIIAGSNHYYSEYKVLSIILGYTLF